MSLNLRSRSLRLIVLSVFILLHPVVTHAQTQSSDEAIWQQFLQWLPSAPPVANPGVLLQQYRARIQSTGASLEEANRQTDVIQRAMRERTDGWRIMFNNIYANDKPGFTVQPNALLISTVEGRKPGRALDVGMGQGRNAVFLALKGWDVTGFDVSDEGIAIARKNAERAGVKLNAVVESDEKFDYGTERWDLIVFMYEPFPITSARYVERLRRSMKAGAQVVVESFAEEANTPNRPATAIDPQHLLAAFKDFRILHFQDVVAEPDWGGPNKRRVVRLVAEKRP
jgi:SAM-dependent methyltransferase